MNRNVTVLTSAKGGAGTSTITAGLACALAQRGCSTLVLDLQPLVDTAPALLGSVEQSPYHLGDVAQGRCSLEETFSKCAVTGVTVAAAPRIPSELPDGETLHRWLQEAGCSFDQVLLELPWWGDCFASAADEAATTLIVTNPDRASIALCDRFRTSPPGQSISRPRLVLNRFHRKEFWKSEEFEDLDALIDAAGLQLISVVPEDPNLSADVTETMERTKQYERQRFSQKGDAGGVALHCLAARLLGENVPLRNLDRL